MKKGNIRSLVFLLFAAVLFSCCTSYKKVPYMQTKSAETSIETTYAKSDVRFQVDDVLGITVNASGEPSVAADFNLPLQPLAENDNSGESGVAQGFGRQTYLVDQHGEINFPVLGTIQVEGLNREELEAKLKTLLRKYLKTDPIITIRLMNYRISVLGEVNRPGQYTVSGNHVNLMEALSLAGDMSIYGRRDKVQLLRTLPSGELKIVKLDLTKANIAASPYFYLQQNDVLYVEPNKARSKSADIGSQTGIVISIGSLLLSVVNLIVLIAK